MKKLYVWTEFSPDYTEGLAFAIAESLEEAKRLAEQAFGFRPDVWGKLHKHKLGVKVGYAVCGGG